MNWWKLMPATLIAVSVLVELRGENLKPIIVELFTSEGCSSCPPADRLLMEFQESQPVPGAVIIPLGEHVDYWDRLGWKDPYSDSRFSERQRQFGRVWKTDQIYTPQMIINGGSGFVGSHRQEALQALTQAAGYQPLPVELELKAVSDMPNAFQVAIRVLGLDNLAGDRDRLRLRLAITEDNLETRVRNGENSGRTLRHAAVVRKFEPLGTFRKGGPTFETTTRIRLESDWKRQDLAVVVFVENLRSLEILGGAIERIP